MGLSAIAFMTVLSPIMMKREPQSLNSECPPPNVPTRLYITSGNKFQSHKFTEMISKAFRIPEQNNEFDEMKRFLIVMRNME